MEISNHPLVFCLGEILYDLLSDNPGLKVNEVHSWTSFMGGAPANVAFALRKLNIPVAFIGRVGSDQAGKDLVETLERHQIGIEGVQQDTGAPTRKVYVERSLTGDRNFAGFGKFKTSDFADTFLDANAIPFSPLLGAKFLVSGTLLLAYPESRKSLEAVMDYCVEKAVPIILDINWRNVFWENEAEGIELIKSHIHKAFLVKFSKEEAELLYETHDIEKVSAKLPHSQIVLITDGDQGCQYKIGNQKGFVPAYKIKSIDTTGAGDSFLAGITYQLIQEGYSENITAERARYMVEFASAMGALTTMGPGAILPQPSLDSILDFMKSYSSST